jgi:hypothetical protein
MKTRRLPWSGAVVIVVGLVTLALVAIAGQTSRTPSSRPSTPSATQVGSPTPQGRPWRAARTPWGDPDLQGSYTNKDENGIPLERPNQFAGKTIDEIKGSEFADIVRQRQKEGAERAPIIGGEETGAGPVHWYEFYEAKNSRPWLIVDPPDGKIPALTPDAQRRAAALVAARRGHGESDSAEDRSLYDRCITRGVPGSMMPAIYGNSYQLVQSPGYVAIRYEMIHETRLIPLDGRPHAGKDIRLYMGDARGHFEGQTLVVETTNLNGKESADLVGYGSPDRGASDSLRIVERFTPTAANTLGWSVTLDDSRTWSRPWTFAMNLTKDESQPVFEYACHEGNYGLTNILSAARAEEPKK